MNRSIGRPAVATAVLGALFAILLVLVRLQPGPLPGDVQLERDLQALGIVPISSTVGESVLLFGPLLAAVVVFIVRGQWRIALWLLAAVISCDIVAGVVQVADGRPGPSSALVHVVEQQSGTFPSVSVAHALVFAGVVSLFAWRWPVRGAWMALIFAVGASVVALSSALVIDLGDHWPSDVLGGLIFGGAWTLVVLMIATRSRLTQRDRTVQHAAQN